MLSDHELLQPATAEDFGYYLRMYALRSHDPGRAAVLALSNDVLSTARCFMTSDRLSGVAVQNDGTGIGMYSFVRGRAKNIVEYAISQGAWRLECYDFPALVSLYECVGGVVVSRTPFDPSKAEPRFLKANLGTPDFIVVELASH